MCSSQSDIFSGSAASGELEQVLQGGQINNDERRPILHNHPRSCTVSPNLWSSCGVYNKSNYLASCYNLCWFNNGRPGPKAVRLFCFGGGFSRFGDVLAAFLMFAFALLPFAAAWPFFVDNLKKDYLFGLLISTASVEFVLIFWHVYCIYAIKYKNCEVWESSWFTFPVKTISKDIGKNPGGSVLLDLVGKLQVIDVSVQDLCRLNSALHQLTVNEREKLATRIENFALDRAAIILYSQGFIAEFIVRCMYGAVLLALMSAASFALLTWKILTLKL